MGRKRSHAESSTPEPRTPCTKRLVIVKANNSAHLTPEAKRRRFEQIQAAILSFPSTPHSAPSCIPIQQVPATSSAQTGVSGREHFESAAPLPSINDALLNVGATTSAASSARAVPQTDLDEEEFWLATPSFPVAKPPRGEFSAAGYYLESKTNGAHHLIEANTSPAGQGGIPTPPRSSSFVEREAGSRSSTAQMSETLRQSWSPGLAQTMSSDGTEELDPLPQIHDDLVSPSP
jgi:hypothetical protein